MASSLVCKKCDRTCFIFTEYGCSDPACPYEKSLGPLRSDEEVRKARMATMKNSPEFEKYIDLVWDKVFDNGLA